MEQVRYSQQNKSRYVQLCQQYNYELLQIGNGDSTRFVCLSLQLHIAKSSVPKRWGQPCFIRECGTLAN